MRCPTLILLRLSSVLGVNYLICRRIRCCLPKPAEIEINAPGALVVISISRAFRARSVKHSSLWNLSSSKRDFFYCFHQILLVQTPNVWLERTKEGQQVSKKTVLLRMLWLVKIKEKFWKSDSHLLIPFDPCLVWLHTCFRFVQVFMVPSVWIALCLAIPRLSPWQVWISQHLLEDES